MEVIVKFIFGATVIAFLINFLAIIGYIATKIRDIVYKKYRINILGVLYFAGDGHGYSEYIFTGLFVIGVMLFWFGSIYMTCQLGSYMYSLI